MNRLKNYVIYNVLPNKYIVLSHRTYLGSFRSRFDSDVLSQGIIFTNVTNTLLILVCDLGE